MRAMSSGHGTRGSAVVELAILLPLYALVILATLYLGYGWLVHQEETESNLYAAHIPNNQFSRSDFSELFYVAYEGNPAQTEDNPGHEDRQVFSGDNPASGNDEMDFHDILQELSYTFWGGFEMQGGTLVWTNRGGKNAVGRHIEEHEIMEPDCLDSMAWMLNGWVTRNEVETRYDYNPALLGGMNADAGPAAGDVSGTRFEPLEITTHVDALVRGNKVNPMVNGKRGVSSEIYDLIEQWGDSEKMEGYPDFGGTRKFWDQDYRPDLP